MTEKPPRIEYVEARRVLLDALVALRPHLGAVVLVGAQAVYLRTDGRLPTYQAFTTDADLVITPELLAGAPLLGAAMETAGFVYTGEPGIWERRVHRHGFDGALAVPVDLIVPSQIAPEAGSRGARLPGGHGKTTARKCDGVEGAVVDFDPFEISSLESDDHRRIVVNVAGPAALLVAKSYKLGERLETPRRLLAKDAGDVYRLIDATATTDMAAATMRLLRDDRTAATARRGLLHLRTLFLTPRSTGITLATQALAGVVDEPTVTTVMTGYIRELLELVDS
ncbi:hypothetical protein [Candidatus Poriferisocius sp.]|uniref:hypothetical protein n=1 Tax=Candidatus Poriferisocius sp. TaxID=3101276 RepID=UPI003B5CDC75